jgi:hypothetical protein
LVTPGITLLTLHGEGGKFIHVNSRASERTGEMLDSTAVTSNANGKLITIRRVVDNTRLSSSERMELILRVAAEYDSATTGSVERHRAARVPNSRQYESE